MTVIDSFLPDVFPAILYNNYMLLVHDSLQDFATG